MFGVLDASFQCLMCWMLISLSRTSASVLKPTSHTQHPTLHDLHQATCNLHPTLHTLHLTSLCLLFVFMASLRMYSDRSCTKIHVSPRWQNLVKNSEFQTL
jgi:hypothetical protein